jgi:hypothetical protein
MKIVPIIQIRHRDGPRGRCPFGDLHHTMCQVYSAPPGAAGPNKTIRRRQVNDSRAQIANPRERLGRPASGGAGRLRTSGRRQTIHATETRPESLAEYGDHRSVPPRAQAQALGRRRFCPASSSKQIHALVAAASLVPSPRWWLGLCSVFKQTLG